MDIPHCNICGGTGFIPRGARPNAVCTGCGADERTRLLWLVLAARGMPRAGMRVLHLAPEAALAPRLHALVGDGYEPVDIEPERFPFAPGIRRLDLVAEAASLPSRHYDLILHSHVMEHVPCNITAVLFHLHRALKDDGAQICCIPITRNQYWEEDFGPVAPEDATRRFGQHDHVRRFGREDIDRTLGMIFRLPDPYDLLARFDRETLIRHQIPERVWTGWSPTAVLRLEKDDLLLIA